MGVKIIRPHCPVCGEQLRHGRVPPFCSKKCEVHESGYTPRYAELKAKLEGTTAWKPLPIEPITHIHSSKPILILSDVHCPLHSKEWLEKAISFGKNVDCEKVIISGDFIDANQISKHIGGYYRRRSELEDDFKAAESLLNVVSEMFKEVYFLGGNHDVDRLVKVFRGEVAVQRLWKMFGEHKNVKVSARSFINVNQNVVVGHPRQYSRLRGGIAQKIAQQWQKHIALGHGHHSAMAVTSDGRWQAVDMPCLADLSNFEYTTFEINDCPKPLNGFTVIFGESIQVFDKFTSSYVWKHSQYDNSSLHR